MLGVFFLTVYFVASPFTVDGESMETTLHDKDTHFLYKLPVTFGNFNQVGYQPKRGEVVVFREQTFGYDEEDPVETQHVVKRVIGLPGDRVLLKDGIITIFNESNKNGFVPDQSSNWGGVIEPSVDMYTDIVLQSGELFVAGDNRNGSIDSRFYGPINTDQVIGRVFYSVEENQKPFSNY
jgi:signal peptidase I